MGNYYLKVPFSLFNDRGFMLMPRDMRYAEIQLLRIAKELDEDGFLPSIPDIAWTLRETVDQVANDISYLIQHGRIAERDNRYYIPHYNETQKNLSSAERSKRARSKRKNTDDSNSNSIELYDVLKTTRKSVDEAQSSPVSSRKSPEGQKDPITIRNGNVSETTRKSVEYTDDELVGFVLEVEHYWFDLTGGRKPGDKKTYIDEYFSPINELLRRIGWEVNEAKTLMREKRLQWINDDMTPYRAGPVVASILADLERGKNTEVKMEASDLIEALSN